MRFKILMIADDLSSLRVDRQLLRDKNLLVYTCSASESVDVLIEEIAPDVVFINPETISSEATDTYNTIAANPKFTTLPLIYKLPDDSSYLVNRKRIAVKNRIADNLLSAIKIALNTPTHHLPKTYNLSASLHTSHMDARA